MQGALRSCLDEVDSRGKSGGLVITRVFMMLAFSVPSIAIAQGTGPGLAVPVPEREQVYVRADSFRTATGTP
jgi:hypothetical protein